MTIDTPKESHLPQLKRLWQQAFGDSDKEIALFFEKGFSPDRCRIALREGGVLGALYWFPCAWEGKRLAYLYAIATDAAYQKQGICTRLMEDTHRHLASLGFSGAVLVPARSELFAFYQRFGYAPFGGLQQSTVTCGSASLPLTKITAAEYCVQRKALLPANGILQEDAFLPLLDATYDFYAGDGWLLAGKEAGNCWEGAEYLGDQKNLPGILCALKRNSGSFRCPGEDFPFAMFRSFTADTAAPGYFAFALD